MNPSIFMESKLEDDLRIRLLEDDPKAEMKRHHLCKVAKIKDSNRDNKITNRVSYLEREREIDR